MLAGLRPLAVRTGDVEASDSRIMTPVIICISFLSTSDIFMVDIKYCEFVALIHFLAALVCSHSKE